MRRFAIATACLLAMAGCTAADLSQTQSAINLGCTAAPVLDGSASAAVQTDIAQGCTTEQTLAPVVAPLITTPSP